MNMIRSDQWVSSFVKCEAATGPRIPQASSGTRPHAANAIESQGPTGYSR